MAGPLALQARHQGTFERGMGFLFEQVHQRRAGQGVVGGIAEQLDPGPVGVDDDAFLHVGDGVGGAFQKVMQLFAVLACRGQRGEQRPFQAIGPQLTRGHRLQAAAVGERDHVLRTETHGLGDGVFIDVFAHDEHRHFRRVLLPDLHHRFEIDFQLFDERDQHLWIELGQGIAQIACVGQPGAMHRMAAVAQGTVDRFDVVLRRRHHDHGNGTQVWHCRSPRLMGTEV